jgi:oligoribonuclease NrnB/cAMP/cGMP phosphodiesterase (DHH superfamily)
MSNLVIYHSNCFDGFGAAWVCRKALTLDYIGESNTYIPAKYGDEPPLDVKGKHVYVVDFSYPRNVLEEMKSDAASLVVLDHHKTSEAALKGLDYCIFDMKRSGAMMAWDYLNPGKTAPRIIQYVMDRDLWNWKLPNTSEVNAWISSFERDFEVWDGLDESMKQNLDYCVHDGEQILRYERQKIKEICTEAVMMCIDGENTIPVINTNYPFGSSCGDYLNRTHPEAKYAAYYFDRSDGEQQWGLRSVGDFDVSEIAKRFGGGGHRNASGFVKGKITR